MNAISNQDRIEASDRAEVDALVAMVEGEIVAELSSRDARTQRGLAERLNVNEDYVRAALRNLVAERKVHRTVIFVSGIIEYRAV